MTENERLQAAGLSSPGDSRARVWIHVWVESLSDETVAFPVSGERKRDKAKGGTGLTKQGMK